MRFLPAIAIFAYWCIVNINPEWVYDYVMLNTLCIALFVLSVSYALEDGYKLFGILCFVIGIGLYYGTLIIILETPTIVLVLRPSLQIALAVLNTTGSAFAFLGAASFGLWLASTPLDTKQTDVKYGALFFTAIVIFVWIFGMNMDFPIPGIELLYSTILVILSSLFVPRRQFISAFYYVLGLALAFWGLLVIQEVSTFFLGYYLRIIGTICFILFALPLGSSPIYSQDHPENPLYIITTLWILVEISLIQRLFIFSPARVFAIYAMIYFSMKILKTKHPVLTGIGILIGFVLAVGGVVIYLLGIFINLVVVCGGLTLAVIGHSLLLFCSFSFGESLRIRFRERTRIISGIGLLLVFAGLISGMVGLFSIPLGVIVIDLGPISFLYLDVLFFVLVSLGSMLIVLKPRNAWSIIGAFGFANAPIVLFSDFFETVQLFYYPLLALMIYFTVQRLRVDTVKMDGVPRKKKVIPMEITPETLIKSGLEKEPVIRPKESIETIEPVQSTDFEPDIPIVKPPPVEEVSLPEPSEPVEVAEVAERVVTDKSIQTEQQVIPVIEGEILSDENRMARNWYNRAFGFLEVGDLKAAINAVETALKWQPDLPQALALKKELSEK